MATYQEIIVNPPFDNNSIVKTISNLLIGAYSVEVLSVGESLVLRVWFEQHCDLPQHQPCA